MRVVVSQFQGIDNTPGLPLAAGVVVASARLDPRIRAEATFRIDVERGAIDEVVAGYGRADVLGFSLYPWNAAYSLEVIRAARRALPEALIVVGGPAVPRKPEAARRVVAENPDVDVFVFSEGEIAFRELLGAHLRQTDLAPVGSIAFRRDGDVVFTAPPIRVRDFSETASPYLDGTFDELVAEGRWRFAMALLETNRGCPFTCTFCDWSLTPKVVEFPIDRVRAELDWIADHDFGHVCITDANFGIRPRDHDIARYLADGRRRTGSPTYCYFYLTKNNAKKNLGTIEILQEAGIGCCIGLAVQDFDEDVLEAVQRDNIQSGESMLLRDICASRGLPTLNELIFGLPRQTFASFTRTLVQAMPSWPKHTFVVFQCRLIESTAMATPESRAEFGIQTRRCLWRSANPNWDPIVEEYQELVVGTDDMPMNDWIRTYRLVHLAGAAYNLRLLRVVLQWLDEVVHADLGAYFDHLAAALVSAPPGSVLAELGEVICQFVSSILASGPFALPMPGSQAPVEPADALLVTAMTRVDEFYAEVALQTRAFLGRDIEGLDEVFRFQALITPRFGADDPMEAPFGWDWAAFAETGGRAVAPPRRDTRVRFEPPTYVMMEDAPSFAGTHLMCVKSGMSTGEVTVVAERVARLAG